MLHQDRVSAVLFLRDGRLISRDARELILWDTETGLPQARFKLSGETMYDVELRLTLVENEVITFPTSSKQPIQVLRIGTAEIKEVFRWKLTKKEADSVFAAWDGHQLVVGTLLAVETIDAKTKKPIRRTESPVSHYQYNKVAVSGDGKWTAWTDEHQKSISILNNETGKVAKKIKAKHLGDSSTPAMAITPDGCFLEFCQYKNDQLVLQRFSFDKNATETTISSSIKAAKVRIEQLWGSPDNTLTIVEKVFENLTLLNRQTGKSEILLEINGGIPSAAFTTDNKRCAISDGKRVSTYDLESGQRVATYNGPSAPLSHLNFLKSTGNLLTAQSINVEEIDPHGFQVVRELPIRNKKGIMQGRYIVSKENDQYVLYDSVEGSLNNIYDKTGLHFDQSEYNFISADFSHLDAPHLQMWSIEGKPGIRFCPYDEDSEPETLKLFPSGNQVALIRNEELQIWDTETGQMLRSRKGVEAYMLIISSDEKWIAGLDEEKHLHLFNSDTLEEWWNNELEDYLPNIAFSPNSTTILVNGTKDLHFINVETGETTQTMGFDSRIESFCIGNESRIYVSLEDTRLVTVDASDCLETVLQGHKNEVAEEIHEDFYSWPENKLLKEKKLRKLLKTANWKAFRPEVDLLPLRRALAALAEKGGPGELHRAISAKLIPDHGRLLHRFGHQTPMIAHAISPDGKWLATGSFVGDNYADGGELMVWEVATGRCVNNVWQVEGGIAWPDYSDCMQWSPDGKLLGIAYNTNCIGIFNPFSPSSHPESEISVTDGWSRPPAWCWAPDSQQIMVSCWGDDSPIPGCISPINEPYLIEKDVRWFGAEIPDSMVPDDEESLDLQPFGHAFWSREGKLIYGYNDHDQAFGIDAETGEMKWYTDIGQPVAFDPDDEHFAHNLAGFLFYETQTGLPTFKLPMIVGVTHAWWSPVPGQQRIAAMVTRGNAFDAEPGIHIYDQREFLCSLDTVPRPTSYGDGGDANSWAWSPDGNQAAVLTQHEVQIWNISANPVIHISIKVNLRTTAIAWGAENTLVCVAAEQLEFYDIATGQLKTRYDMHLPGGMTRPTLDAAPLDGVDENFPDGFWLQPCASVLHEEKQHWLIAYEDGKVVCPPALESVVADELTFAIGGRYAWPLEWAERRVAPDLVTATTTWDLPYNLADIETEPATKRHEDFFRPCNVRKPQKPWSKKDFKDIRKESEVEEYWMPTQAPGAYEAPVVFKDETVTEQNLRPLIGKVVLYAEDYDPNRAQTGALMAIDDDSVMLIYHDDRTMGTSWSSFEDLVYIGEALPK